LIEILKLIIGPVTGAAIALIVNRLFEIRNKKPVIVFTIDHVFDIDTDKMYGTHHSGYQLICYNIGQVPVFIQSLEIFNKKDFLVDIIPTPKKETKSLIPFSIMKYDISFEDMDSILHYCKERKKKKLKIIAYGVDNKHYKGYINLWWVKVINDDVFDSMNS
jgi:hypothetical protein